MYCTKADMIARGWENELIGLTNKIGTGVIDDTILNQAILDACSDIDMYLQTRYSLPISAPVENLTRMACDIARYYLFESSVTEQVQKRYDITLKTLVAISNGQIELGIDAIPATSIVSSSTLIQASCRFDNGY